MKFKILITILFLYTNCYSASKSLSLPAELNKIAMQAAVDAKAKHEAYVKTDPTQAAGAGAGQVQSTNAQWVDSDLYKYKVGNEIRLPVFHNQKKYVRVLRGHTGYINHLKRLRYGNLISFSYDDQTARVWDLTKPVGKECIGVFQTYGDKVFPKDVFNVMQLVGGAVIAWQNNWDEKNRRQIQIFDIEKKKMMTLVNFNIHQAESLIQLRDGRLVTSYKDGKLCVWDPRLLKGNDPNKDQRCVETFSYCKCSKNECSRSGSSAPLIELADGRVAFAHYENVYILDLKKDNKKQDKIVAQIAIGQAPKPTTYWEAFPPLILYFVADIVQRDDDGKLIIYCNNTSPAQFCFKGPYSWDLKTGKLLLEYVDSNANFQQECALEKELLSLPEFLGI